MTDRSTSNYGPPPEGPSPWNVGLIYFAGLLMIMVGGFQALIGLVALFHDDFFATTPNYILRFDTTSWGWIHIIFGLLVLFAGLAVLRGQTWGQVVGIILAGLSAFANFAFIPYYPFWSITIIVLDVFVIWALAVHGRDITR